MNFTPVLSGVTAAALLWAAPSTQETLTPVPADLTLDAASENFDASLWAQGLRDDSLERRLANHDALLRAADHNPAVRSQLQDWAANEEQLELAFTASLMLRELDARPQRSFPGHGRLPSVFGGGANGGGSIDDLFRELQSFDPFGARSGSNFGPGAGGTLHGFPQSPGLQSLQQSSGVRIEVGPDGVKVHVEETENGESKTRSYEADSMQELLELHPELEAELGAAGGMQIPSWLGNGARAVAPQSAPDFPRGLRSLRPVAPPMHQLGIRMLLPEMRRMNFDGVHDDVGLQVVEVVPGSLAAAIGVQPGELVIAIDGRTIRSAQDVRDALSDHVEGQSLEVECVNTEGKVRVRTWSGVGQHEAGAMRKPL